MKLNAVHELLAENGLNTNVMPDYKGGVYVQMLNVDSDKIKTLSDTLKQHYKIVKKQVLKNQDNADVMIRIKEK